MNKLAMFFIGIMMLVIVFIAMFFTGAIFDASQRATVETYFFQSNNYSYQRPGVPEAPKQLGDSKLFAMLVKKYVTEYLYVLPEVADIDHRESDKGPLGTMSWGDTFAKWQENIAPQIREMAQDGVLRTVSVDTPLKYGDFYQVEFQLKTWSRPNDMDEVPTVQTGIMQFKVHGKPTATDTEFHPEIYEENLNRLHTAIDKGYDPVGVFYFKVSDVIIHME